MKHQPTGKQMQIVVTNQKIFYDWKNNEKSTFYMPINTECKKGYITKDLNGREIGITYEADDERKLRIVGNAYMLLYKKYEDELGKYRLVKTKSGKIFPFCRLEEVLETEDQYDALQIEI